MCMLEKQNLSWLQSFYIEVIGLRIFFYLLVYFFLSFNIPHFVIMHETKGIQENIAGDCLTFIPASPITFQVRLVNNHSILVCLVNFNST